MSSKLLIPLSTLALVGCARHTIPQVTLIPQTRLGTEDFGPGIVSYGSLRMDFALDRNAHVIVLRVTDLTRVETVQPRPGGERTEVARGRHHATAAGWPFTNRHSGYTDVTSCIWGAGGPYFDFASAFDSTAAFRGPALPASYDNCVRHEQLSTAMFGLGAGAVPRGQAPNAAYWLLIVSDVPTRGDELQERLATMEWPGSAVNAVRNLPEALVGRRTTRWAAYYVLVGDSPKRLR